MMKQKYIEEIKQKFGVDVVRLKRNSDGDVLVQSDIDESLKRVCLIYSNRRNYNRISNGFQL